VQDPLFEPIRVGALALANRIVMPAMHLQMARGHEVTDPIVAFYGERARGGAGLVTVGFATVDAHAGSPAHIGAHRDAFVPGLARLAAEIHAGGARAAVQLNHAGRYAHSRALGGETPVAPSSVPCRLTGETPRALAEPEIEAIVAAFGDAARRVKEAGFDGVEILCGTGYLVSAFLSPLTNRRTDRWGGSLENRMRFGVEVVRAVRAAVGPGVAVLARVNGMEGMEGGTGRDELLEFAAGLAAEGADALGVNVGWHESRFPQVVASVPRGAFAHLARAVKARVDVPVAASHRINDPALARALLAAGTCDLVAMGRPLIADPCLPEKAREGREDEIVHCVACGQGCLDQVLAMKPVQCLVNPRAGHEAERTHGPARRAVKVLVVGGGPAGMSAAMAAADRGHAVVLYERGARLGGQLQEAGAPPGRGELAGLALDLARQLDLRGVRVELGREVDGGVMDAERPDALVLATGATPIAPPIPGADLPSVVQAAAVLRGERSPGRRVVVVGGGAVGVETALFLAERGTVSAETARFLVEHGAEPLDDVRALLLRGTRRITVVELTGELGRNLGRTTRWTLLRELELRGVETRPGTRVLEIGTSAVRLEREGRVEEIPADTVVLAVGARSHDPLQPLARARGIPFRVVGDAASVATALEAIHQGFVAGSEIAV
jgi:2,4-dienoyl-CoA reductase (NADPH2)